MLKLNTKLCSHISYSSWVWDRQPVVPDVRLMTSRKLTSGFDFWSRVHLHLAVLHLPIKFNTYSFIQTGDWHSPKLKTAATAILNFQVMWIWHILAPRQSCAWALCQIWFTYLPQSVLQNDAVLFLTSLDDVTRIDFRFQFLVICSSYDHMTRVRCIFPSNLVQISSLKPRYWLFRNSRRRLSLNGCE